MKKFTKEILLWFIGGYTYYLIECAFHLITQGQAYSHWSMFVLFGGLFLAIGGINEYFSWETPFWKQCIIGAVVVTILECMTGYIVNIWLGWNVWDYSNLPFSFFNNQINLFFSLAWVLLSGVAIVVDDWLRYWLFKEEKPRYKLV